MNKFNPMITDPVIIGLKYAETKGFVSVTPGGNRKLWFDMTKPGRQPSQMAEDNYHFIIAATIIFKNGTQSCQSIETDIQTL